ncbi:MAG: helix-turn-helix transcriptional regulator [Oscillospiraceae bacterium]|nr:helix-turn-helix transcriptional regulator [Oscillospiraceae bacterium]
MNLPAKITVTKICDIVNVISSKGRRKIMRNRKSYGISFCADGEIIYTHNGKQFKSNKDCAVILPQDSTYSLFCTHSGRFPVINFMCTERITDEFIVIDIHNSAKYFESFNRLIQLSPEENYARMTVMYEILTGLSREGNMRGIVKIEEYIRENLSDSELSNSDLAELLEISETALRKKFKTVFGSTPKQYIIDLRINEAKHLLSLGEKKVLDISEACGFASVYHFSRAFKARTGKTPCEYARSLREYII